MQWSLKCIQNTQRAGTALQLVPRINAWNIQMKPWHPFVHSEKNPWRESGDSGLGYNHPGSQIYWWVVSCCPLAGKELECLAPKWRWLRKPCVAQSPGLVPFCSSAEMLWNRRAIRLGSEGWRHWPPFKFLARDAWARNQGAPVGLGPGLGLPESHAVLFCKPISWVCSHFFWKRKLGTHKLPEHSQVSTTW